MVVIGEQNRHRIGEDHVHDLNHMTGIGTEALGIEIIDPGVEAIHQSVIKIIRPRHVTIDVIRTKD